MTTQKQLLIKQTALTLLALIIGLFTFVMDWDGQYFDEFMFLSVFSFLVSLFFIPLMALYFIRKDNLKNFGKFFRFLSYSSIVIVFLIFTTIITDFYSGFGEALQYLSTGHLMGAWWTLYYSFITPSISAVLIYLVIITLLYSAIMINKKIA